MLPLTSQVSSLPLSQRLKQLGVKQDSYFMWVRMLESGKYEIQPVRFQRHSVKECSAFTVAELEKHMPETLKGTQLIMWKFCGTYSCGNERYRESAPTQVDATAKMLIYLIENKLIKI